MVAAALVVAMRAEGAAGEGPPATVRIETVLAGDRLALADGRTLRLAGIQVPGADGDARRLLAQLLDGAAVRLAPAAVATDRHGRVVAQVERADGLWLQGALLERGLAQVQTRPGEVARAGEMLALERAARAARLGLWAEARFAPRRAEELTGDDRGFRIVRGRVLRLAQVRDFVYLNFGDDWWSDFTLRVRRADLKGAFAAAGVDVLGLEGRLVEVRGQVIEAGGPLIELSHPEQIEVLP